MLKKTDFASDATAFANKVLPFPGGPKSSNPFAGLLKPINQAISISKL